MKLYNKKTCVGSTWKLSMVSDFVSRTSVSVAVKGAGSLIFTLSDDEALEIHAIIERSAARALGDIVEKAAQT